MAVRKIVQISDPLHGSVHISQMEKVIISTQMFNRLHHVLQNSTAFMTFPSNKTSRFAHSIGVMHLGGEMFKYALTNAEQATVLQLLNYVDGYLHRLPENDSFRMDIRGRVRETRQYQQAFTDLKADMAATSLDDPFYQANTPFLVPEDRMYSYVVLYQALRLAALLHDLGHPPFSHITEDALDRVYATLQSKVDREEPLTAREEQYHRDIGAYKQSNEKLHEKLSKHLVEHIFNFLIDSIPATEMGKKIFYIHIKYVTLDILLDATPEFKAVHFIVDGVIDCDRLDYVSRDPMASGFRDGSIEYERLIKTMKLLPGGDCFTFCHSVRAMSTIEDFLQRRWKLYKNVILHHRVVKTDTLLFQVIRSLTMEYLASESPEASDSDYDYVIPNDISGLWKTVGKSFNLTEIDYINHFIQWDDSWLLSCLRREYFKRKHENGGNNDLLTIQLEELLSNRKYYFSLFKRYDGMLPIDLSLVQHFQQDCLDQISDVEEVQASVEFVRKYKTTYLEKREQGIDWSTRVPVHGLFLIALAELFKNWGKDKEFMHMLQEVLDSLKEEFQVKDFILKQIKLSTGITDESVVYDGDQIQTIQATSRIESDLKINKAVFPPYFIYVYSDEEILPDDLLRMKHEIGVRLAERVKNFIQQFGEADTNV